LPARGDVIVLDEAGMASSAQIANMIKITRAHGAKLVLVGDPDQLQPINAGAAFRALLEENGFAELAEIRRQRDDWQREATRAIARNDVAAGIAAYRKHGGLITTETKDQAIEQLVEEWRCHVLDGGPFATAKDTIVITHRNDDVQGINAILRSIVKDAGHLRDEILYQTASGPRTFATGDRVLMLKNATVSGEAGAVKVENGTLGTVTATANGTLSVTLDDGTRARLNAEAYRDIDYGYATTIHKSQGITVDTTLVLVTPTMDRHATYVAFSRHRHTVKLFAPQEGFHDSLEATIGRNTTKSTTRDYRHTHAYRDAFAMRRGLDNPSRIVAVPNAALRAKHAALNALSSAAQAAMRAIQQRYTLLTAHTSRSDEPHTRGTPNHFQTAATVKPDTKGRPMSESATTTYQQPVPLKFDYSVEGNEARITFGYSKEANVMLGEALKPGSIAFKDGAWTTPLSDDVNTREIQLTKINIASTRIGAHFAKVNQNQTHANRIAADDQLVSADVKLSVRNRTLAVQIPPVRSAIEALKAVGATYVPKNGENGNYWRTPTPYPEAADKASNAIMAAANLIQEEKKSIGLTQSVTSTHDEMLVSRAKDKVWVDMPNMAGANAILKADGPAAATWDRSAGAWAIPVNSATIDDLNGRLAKVADYFDNAMLQPHKGRPGLDYNANDIDSLKMYTPQEYANEPKIRGYVDSVVRDIDRAITPAEKKILLDTAPGAAVQHERFDKSHGVPAVQELVRLTQNIQSQGMKQVFANEQVQAQTKTQSQGIGQ
jgi:AAA domain/Viral (Superfamily 1) RNA helicase